MKKKLAKDMNMQFTERKIQKTNSLLICNQRSSNNRIPFLLVKLSRFFKKLKEE